MPDTPKKAIKAYFDKGVEIGATHMFLIKDHMGNDYPIFIGPEKETIADLDGTPKEILALYQLDGKDVIEVYDLKKDKQTQVDKARTWNIK